jgi:hypothetical protein
MYRARDTATGVVLAERLRAAHTHWTRLKGLLGTRSLDPGDGLWLKPCNQVHMIGMRYAIDVVFLDKDHRVVRAISGLQPGTISPKMAGAASVLELPVGTLLRADLREGAQIEIAGQPATGDAETGRAIDQHPRRFWVRCFSWAMGFILVTSFLVLLGRAVITWEKPCPDFVCFWAGGELIVSGESPYDAVLQAKIQGEHGWDKATDGLGFFDFLPYYNPPSLLALVSVLLVPLGFSTARMAWLVINTELFFITGYMLRNTVAAVSPVVPMVLVPIFGLSVLSVLVGQVTAMVFFLMAAAWRLLQRRWDRSAGWVLAWMSIKPQLSTLLVMATLVWLARQRRWQAIEGFVTGSVVLVALSTWLVPSWPLQLTQVMVQTPLITITFPKLETTWLLVLRSLGLKGWLLWVSYAVVALPFGWAVLRSALRRSSTIDKVFALSILATFFIAPTARPYDEPILVIPLLVLLGKRIPEFVGAVLLVVLAVLPYVHLLCWVPSIGNIPAHVWFFWIPLLLASLWFGSQIQRARIRTSTCSG